MTRFTPNVGDGRGFNAERPRREGAKGGEHPTTNIERPTPKAFGVRCFPCASPRLGVLAFENYFSEMTRMGTVMVPCCHEPALEM